VSPDLTPGPDLRSEVLIETSAPGVRRVSFSEADVAQDKATIIEEQAIQFVMAKPCQQKHLSPVPALTSL